MQWTVACGNDSNLKSPFVKTDSVVKHGCATVDVGVAREESLDPLHSTVAEIPEELYQAQFLQRLWHIASPGMY